MKKENPSLSQGVRCVSIHAPVGGIRVKGCDRENAMSKSDYRRIRKPKMLTAYDIGFKAQRGLDITVKVGGSAPKARRGAISSFSVKSRRRLRDALLTQYVPGLPMVGLTLTMPGNIGNSEAENVQNAEKGVAESLPPSPPPSVAMDAFRTAFQRFRVALARLSPGSAAIYRVELQQRGAPHIHAVVWLSSDGFKSDKQAKSRITELWLEAVEDCGWGDYSRINHSLYGVKWQDLPDRSSAIRYLCDHASKHKQAQLGYKGKQWGYLNRPLLQSRPHRAITDSRAQAAVCRALGKLRRYRIPCPAAPFGSRLSPYHPANGGISYCAPDTVQRLVAWADSLAGAGLA